MAFSHAKLERRMIEKGHNPSSLSLAVGTNRTLVRDIFRRAHVGEPLPKTTKKLADELGCHIGDFYDEPEEAHAPGGEGTGHISADDDLLLDERLILECFEGVDDAVIELGVQISRRRKYLLSILFYKHLKQYSGAERRNAVREFVKVMLA